MSINKHIAGCMMGLFVGDAAGATLEFMRGPFEKDIVKYAMSMPGGGRMNVGKGQVTDDSELAIHLWRALYQHDPKDGFPQNDVAKEYIMWHRSDPFDMGMTCSRAFGYASKADDCCSNALKYNSLSEANGSLMRIAPLAIWAKDLPDTDIITFARIEAMLSHPNQLCQDANAIYCLTIAYLLRNVGDADGALQYIERYVKDMHPTINGWFDAAMKIDISTYQCIYNIGHVKHAFILAFHCLKNKYDFEQGIFLVLQRGGDTDTNAAIVGAMLGALHGYDKIPTYMSEPVLNFNCTMFDEYTSLIGKRRPDTYVIHDFMSKMK